jgi:hypothetical protein
MQRIISINEIFRVRWVFKRNLVDSEGTEAWREELERNGQPRYIPHNHEPQDRAFTLQSGCSIKNEKLLLSGVITTPEKCPGTVSFQIHLSLNKILTRLK